MIALKTTATVHYISASFDQNIFLFDKYVAPFPQMHTQTHEGPRKCVDVKYVSRMFCI